MSRDEICEILRNNGNFELATYFPYPPAVHLRTIAEQSDRASDGISGTIAPGAGDCAQ